MGDSTQYRAWRCYKANKKNLAVLLEDTIVARATPAGKGGVAVVRVSGPLVEAIADQLLAKTIPSRVAHYCQFQASNGSVIDEGIALRFVAPKSFTGEDVLELQGHGGPVIVDLLIKRILGLGARLANPGEFSLRAFLNDKIDLTQAESIADLINATTEQAAQSAIRSLQGEFAAKIKHLVESVKQLRKYIEAAIDFPEEEINFLADKVISTQLHNLLHEVDGVLSAAQQGLVLQEGIRLVIAGLPNAGKSSLLNQLSGEESAIVTEIAGTTRDLLHEQIQLDGLPVHIIDTAGLRETTDVVEQEGVRRAEKEIQHADKVLLVIDSKMKHTDEVNALSEKLIQQVGINKVIKLFNKIDITGEAASETVDQNQLYLSARTGAGIDILQQTIKHVAGFNAQTEGQFIARRRHVKALEQTQQALQAAWQQLTDYKAGELAAEELRYCQQQLNTITGEYTNDDLLSDIFSSFCIGK